MDDIRRTDDLQTDFNDSGFDWRTLVHPASAYAHPRDVLRDPHLTTDEKRAVLSSWASDACAVQSMPGLRRLPGAAAPVSFDDIIDALRALDDDEPTPPRPGGQAMRHRLRWRQRDDDSGALAA